MKSKLSLIFVPLFLISLFALYIWLRMNKPSPLDIPAFSAQTFVSANCSSESGEEVCRIIAQSKEGYFSFKIEGRYKDLIKPTFFMSVDNQCIRALRFKDERQVDYTCLEYFKEEAKSP